MQLNKTHNRDHVLTPAELLAALGIPPGLQEEADIYISETRPDEIHLNAPFGVKRLTAAIWWRFRRLAHS